MNLEYIYSINPDYIINHDLKRTFISSRGKCFHGGASDYNEMIHPEQAKLFSFFTHNKKLKDVIDELVVHFGENHDEVKELIEPFILNKTSFKTNYEGTDFIIPKFFIIPNVKSLKKLSINDFDYEELDFKTRRRFKKPSSITLMLTNKCTTDCLYCYADTKYKINSLLEKDEIIKLIKQCKLEDIVDFGLLGGEVFMHPHWKDIYLALINAGYYPDIISTKMILSDEILQFLSDHNYQNLQISCDTIDKELLSKIWKTNIKYSENFLEGIKKTEKYNIPIQIAITLIKDNSNIDDVIKVLDFFNTLKNVIRVEIGAAFRSLYKSEKENDFMISKTEYIKLQNTILNINKYHFEISFDNNYKERNFYQCDSGSNNFSGSFCSANIDHLFILPDGNATICEQLYWNSKFIVGNIQDSSICEIWNSKEMLKLANLNPKHFQNSSPCKNCNIFNECHKDVNKCWADIIKAYGINNWDYPDPRCLFAPKMENNISFESNN